MEEVRAALEESVRVARKLNGDFLLAVPLQYLGIVAFRRGEHEKAEAYLKEGLLSSVRCSGEEWLTANSLALLATLAASRGDHARATRLYGAAEAIRETMGSTVFYTTPPPSKSGV